MKLCKKLSCSACKEALLSPSKVVQNSALLTRKDAGGLVYPSDSVVTVCMVTERNIRFICGCNACSLPRTRDVMLALQVSVIEKTGHLQLFPSALDASHSCVNDVYDSYKLNLVRLIVNAYSNIRMYSVAKSFTENLRGVSVRSKSNKHVLFMHQ